jgi:hypothetical protein
MPLPVPSVEEDLDLPSSYSEQGRAVQFETLSGQLECLAMSVTYRLPASSASESNMEQPSCFGPSFEVKMQL